ncbi:hypothetical protein TRIUR3_16635 [Triticum urartu]|nr:hypothetical protein TRIUR3_16635 [Triticum urartu]
MLTVGPAKEEKKDGGAKKEGETKKEGDKDTSKQEAHPQYWYALPPYHPHPYHHAYSREEDPNSCIIC